MEEEAWEQADQERISQGIARTHRSVPSPELELDFRRPGRPCGPPADRLFPNRLQALPWLTASSFRPRP